MSDFLEVNNPIISDLQAGIAAEHLVCADLVLNGFTVYLTTQGMPYDLVLDDGNKLYKIQVKATRTHRFILGREEKNPFYMFSVGRNGKNGKRKMYNKNDVDVFAIVAIDTKEIGYLKTSEVRRQMNFKVSAFKGKYINEATTLKKLEAIELRKQGMSFKEIATKLCRTTNMIRHYLYPGPNNKLNGKEGRYITDYTIFNAIKK